MAVEPVEIGVPSFDACAPVFLEWAGPSANVRLFYGPDPILAVDEPRRRGYLVDDVYLAVAWVAEGGDELIWALEDRGVEMKTQASPTTSHDEFLLMVMRSGSPVPSSGPS